MKICKRCGIEKALFLFSSRKDARDGLAYWCNPCKLAASKKAPGYKATHAKYRANNLKKCSAATLASVHKKREYYNARINAWQKAHPEVRARWLRTPEGRARSSADTRRRQAAQIQAVPIWLSLAEEAEIEGYYLFCRIFGGHQVDHIVPLRGKTVSGLHVPWNLQPLTRSENARKGNRLYANERS